MKPNNIVNATVQPFHTNIDEYGLISEKEGRQSALIFNPRALQLDLVISLVGRASVMTDWLDALSCSRADTEMDRILIFQNLHALSQEIRVFADEIARRERIRPEGGAQ